MKYRIIVAVISVSVLSVQAAVVVDFNPSNVDYVDASWDGGTGPVTNALSLSTPIFDSSTVAPIYGAVLSGGPDSDALVRANIDNTDLLLRQDNNDSAGDGNRNYQYGFLLWNAADFSDPSATVFDQSANSSISIVARGFSDGTNFNETRFVIKNNGTYFIAGQEININGGDIASTDTGASLTWAEWADPWGDILAANGSKLGESLTYSAQTFNDVEAVGFVNLLARDTADITFLMTDFQVSTIPEPATVGLIALAGSSLLIVRRVIRL